MLQDFTIGIIRTRISVGYNLCSINRLRTVTILYIVRFFLYYISVFNLIHFFEGIVGIEPTLIINI